MGPFVDVEQPLIAGGMLDATFQQLFQTQVGSSGGGRGGFSLLLNGMNRPCNALSLT
jgi:hypothetical protein